VIGDRRRREKSRDLEPAVAVRRAHHGGLDAHVAQSSDALCPISFDRGSPFELEAELGEKRDSGIEGFHHDADVVHPLKRHAAHTSPVRHAHPTSAPADGCAVGTMASLFVPLPLMWASVRECPASARLAAALSFREGPAGWYGLSTVEGVGCVAGCLTPLVRWPRRVNWCGEILHHHHG
jgi:hypothetical protein